MDERIEGMKYIREARMGLPKQFKTGAIVGTYPYPMLYFGFDRGGLDVIPTKGARRGTNDVLMNITYDEVKFVKPSEIATWLAKSAAELPKILAVDFPLIMNNEFSLDTGATKCQTPMIEFRDMYNKVVACKTLPFKTIVLDSVTGYTDACLSYISSANPNAMADARQWASQAGGLVRKVILSMTCLPCHVVVLLHSFIDKNEITQEVREHPNVYGQMLRDDFFGMFSQVFYAAKDAAGKPVIWPSDKYPVKGIGPRWPQGLPKECAPDFMAIYGKELAL
jgi:hypothetical protein